MRALLEELANFEIEDRLPFESIGGAKSRHFMVFQDKAKTLLAKIAESESMKG